MATTASADFCTPFSRGCPVDSRSRQACRPPTVSRCVLGDRPCRIYRRAVRTSIGHLDLMLDCPPHGGLVSGSCSSGLKLPSWSRTPRRQRSPSLPSDSASRPTPLLRRMVPLVAAHRGLAPPKHTTCVAHKNLVSALAIPSSEQRDALHVAIAAVNGIDFLLTWNCRHLANATLRGKIEKACRDSEVEPPIICTPI